MEQEHKRRPRYKGTHPRTFQEKYKEHDPEKYRADVEKIMAQNVFENIVTHQDTQGIWRVVEGTVNN